MAPSGVLPQQDLTEIFIFVGSGGTVGQTKFQNKPRVQRPVQGPVRPPLVLPRTFLLFLSSCLPPSAFLPFSFFVTILEIIAKSVDEILKLIQNESDFIIHENITKLNLAGTFSTFEF